MTIANPRPAFRESATTLFRPLINNGGIIQLARLLILGPYEFAWGWACYNTYEHARPWLSRRLLTWGTSLANLK